MRFPCAALIIFPRSRWPLTEWRNASPPGPIPPPVLNPRVQFIWVCHQLFLGVIAMLTIAVTGTRNGATPAQLRVAEKFLRRCVEVARERDLLTCFVHGSCKGQADGHQHRRLATLHIAHNPGEERSRQLRSPSEATARTQRYHRSAVRSASGAAEGRDGANARWHLAMQAGRAEFPAAPHHPLALRRLGYERYMDTAGEREYRRKLEKKGERQWLDSLQ